MQAASEDREVDGESGLRGHSAFIMTQRVRVKVRVRSRSGKSVCASRGQVCRVPCAVWRSTNSGEGGKEER